MRGFFYVFSLLVFAFCALFTLLAFADLSQAGGSTNAAFSESIFHVCAGIGGMVLSGILWVLAEISSQMSELAKQTKPVELSKTPTPLLSGE